MTIQQLRCFVTAARYLNIRRASEELYIAQPAVTHHIQKLENELNVMLFHRVNRQIRLTEQGRIFYKDAIEILEQIDKAVEHVHRPPSTENVLRIGCETTLQIEHLTEIYQAFHSEFPDVFISSTELTGQDRKTPLLDGRIDIAFLPSVGHSEDNAIAYAGLYEGQRCCVVPCGHRLAPKEYVTADDFKGETIILLDAEHSPPNNVIFQRYLQMHCPETEFCFSGSSLYSLPMIEAGIGIALMPDCVCPKSDNVVLVPYRPRVSIKLGMMWLKSNETEKLRRFVSIACEKYGQRPPEFAY